jgi:two-component system sensor histidine kinase/response regulator
MAPRGRILLVADNEIDLLVASALLDRLGYATDTAPDGRRALDQLARNRYDAVLMGCHLPDRDGFEVTTELRRREAGRPRVPVIALSAGGDRDRGRCHAAGMDEVLPTPVTLAALDRVLAEWTGGGAAASPAGKATPAAAAPRRRDPAGLAELRDPDPGGYAELMADLARSFVARGADMLRRLADAVRSDDAGAAAHDAHALKGSAGNLGAARLADLAGELETLARRGELTGAREVLRGVEDEFGHVRRGLAELIAEA